MADPRLGETLLAPRLIRLFGRKFEGLELRPLAEADLKKLKGPPFANLLNEALYRPGAGLARIYGFSYEGRYYKLPSPQIFVVHGDGVEVKPGFDPTESFGISGVEYKAEYFAEGVFMWPYDQADHRATLSEEAACRYS